MAKNSLNVLQDQVLARLLSGSTSPWTPPYSEWVRILRHHLRMTQSELAQRAKIPQSHVVAIESAKGDIQLGTLKKVFAALSCDLLLEPKPRQSLKEVLRGRARAVALRRLKQSMGTMALENQAPEGELFKQLLEKKTDEILNDRREKLWDKLHEG